MPEVKMTLSIGYPGANQEEIIEVDDDDYNACETEEQKEELLNENWKDWSSNYIDGGFEVV